MPPTGTFPRNGSFGPAVVGIPNSPSAASSVTTAESTFCGESEPLRTDTTTTTASPAYSPGVSGVTLMVLTDSTLTTMPVDKLIGSSSGASSTGNDGATVGPGDCGSSAGDQVDDGSGTAVDSGAGLPAGAVGTGLVVGSVGEASAGAEQPDRPSTSSETTTAPNAAPDTPRHEEAQPTTGSPQIAVEATGVSLHLVRRETKRMVQLVGRQCKGVDAPAA